MALNFQQAYFPSVLLFGQTITFSNTCMLLFGFHCHYKLITKQIAVPMPPPECWVTFAFIIVTLWEVNMTH